MVNAFKDVDKYLTAIRQAQIEALQQILEKARDNNPGLDVNLCKGWSYQDGIDNDYRNYVWLQFKFESRRYWLTSFYNDIDLGSGNCHTQLGRIAFVYNINVDKGGKNCPSPNRLVDGIWQICPQNTYDPNIRIYDEDYSCEKVYDEFKKFLLEKGEHFN